MNAVILWELSRRKLFTLWWTIGVSGLISLTVLSYLAIDHSSGELDAALQGLTDSAGSFLGGTDFFSPVGYLSSQIYYMTLPILLIILTITLASGLLNRDENDTTVELTLARPISRLKLLAAKAATALIIVTFIGIVSFIVTLVSVELADLTIKFENLLLTHLLSFLFSISFGVISFVLMAVSQMTRRLATIIAIIISFGGYIINSLAGLVDWLEAPARLMPYYYYDTMSLLNGVVERGLLVYLAGIFIIGSIVAAIGYFRRDIG